MDKLTRLDRLQRLVQAADGQVDGRKKLHKLVYLCQRSSTDLGQAFQFHMYGVYSPSLAQDVDAAASWGLLEEEALADGSYEIRLPQDFQPTQFGSSGTGEDGFRTVRELADQPSATLEVLSTIVYLWGLGFRGSALKKPLHDVKGHLQSLFDDAFGLAEKHFDIRIE